MFDDLLDRTRQLDPVKLAHEINNLLKKMSMVEFNLEDLTHTIEDLSDEKAVQLAKAIQQQDTEEIENILRMKEISDFER
jgi:hypothetical protein